MKKYLVILFLSINAPLALAATDQERAYLVDLANALNDLKTLIAKAEQASSGEGYRIRYDRLKKEYNLIIKGISDAAEIPRRTPRTTFIETPDDAVNGVYVE